MRRKPYASMGLDYGLVRAWLGGYGADVLVAGHVHTGVHHRLAAAPAGDVLVLRDWERRRGRRRLGRHLDPRWPFLPGPAGPPDPPALPRPPEGRRRRRARLAAENS